MGFQFVLRDQRRNMSTVTEKSSKAGKKPAKSTAAKKVDAAHPPSSVMVQKAIEGLGEKKGSSLASIKKYIGANYKVDLAKMNVFIRKALKSGIEKKSISASSGMSGRFKLNKVESKPKSSKPKSTKKATPKKAEKTKSVKKTAKKPVAKKAAKKPAAKKEFDTRNQKILRIFWRYIVSLNIKKFERH